MALNQNDRIVFSKAIIEADGKKASVDSAKSAILAAQTKAHNLDQSHKNLIAAKEVFIIKYQAEILSLTGIQRTTLVEQDYLDAADRTVSNVLYPSDTNNPPPSTAPAVWTKTKPYSRNKAVGKLFSEVYPTAGDGEQTLMATILNTIASLELSFSEIQLTTGQYCTTGTGTCSIPMYTDQATCELNLGIWTPGVDVIIAYPAVQTAYNTLLTAVNSWKVILQNEAANVTTNDPDPAKQAQNNAAIAAIPTPIAAIDAWLVYNAFDTGHGQSTCAGFNGYNPLSLGSTRLRSTERNVFKAAVQARQTFVNTRVSQVDTNLGSITQDLSTANATGTGLYFIRWGFIGLRLNFMGGSLMEYKGYSKAIVAQDDLKANIDAAKATYSALLTVSLFSAPANNTKTVHVKSSAGFAVGNNVYIAAEGQEELLRSIEAIDGNRITLGQPVPAKYRPVDGARLYKDIS